MSTAATINGLTHALPDTTDAEWGGILSSYLHGLGYSKRGIMVFGAASGLAASTTAWMVPGYAAVAASEVKVPVPFTGVLSQASIYVLCRTAPDAILTFDLRKNASSITGSLQLSSGQTSVVGGQLLDTAVAAGDTLSLSVTPAGGYTSGGADLSVVFAVKPA